MGFGLTEVFKIYALENMSFSAFALYGQVQLVAMALGWQIVFRTQLSRLSWLSLVAVLLGIVGFLLSDTKTTNLGFLYIGLMFVSSTGATIAGEYLLKRDVRDSLLRQRAWMTPSELLSAAVLLVCMPPHGHDLLERGRRLLSLEKRTR